MSRADFARLALKLKRGEHLGQDGVLYAQLPAITIDAPEPLSVNVDGETSNARCLEYRAREGDLWVHIAHLPGEPDEE